MSVTVFVVDDHPVVRSGLRALLEAQPGLDVVGEAATAEEAIPAVEAARPQVVLSDLRLGAGMDGVGLTRALLARRPSPAVLILTTFDDDRDIVAAVEAGAAGYLLKDASPQDIVDGVLQAAQGRPVLSADLATRVVASVRAPRVHLSDRETEVLGLVAEGLTNREIARRLFVTEATVKTHLVHAFTKLGADSRTAAVARAREAGLLP